MPLYELSMDNIGALQRADFVSEGIGERADLQRLRPYREWPVLKWGLDWDRWKRPGRFPSERRRRLPSARQELLYFGTFKAPDAPDPQWMKFSSSDQPIDRYLMKLEQLSDFVGREHGRIERLALHGCPSLVLTREGAAPRAPAPGQEQETLPPG